MSTYIFLGPTLPVHEARLHCSATYLPPIEQGGLLRLLSDSPKAVGIIDGRFQFVPSVWHKEILAALSQGVHVLGAASMGALRAAETESYGMEGVGEVYEQYKSGELEDDDEVAVTHAAAEQGYRETSDAMVNIRDACRAAVAEGVIPEISANIFLTIAKGLYFPERSWAKVFEIAQENGISSETIRAMNSFRRRHIPVKRRDAIALLKRMADFNHQTERFNASFHLENTVFLNQLQTEVGRESPTTIAAPVARKKVLLEILALEEARRSGDLIDDSSVSEMSTWFRNQWNLVDESAFHSFIERSGLTPQSFTSVMERFAALARVQEHYRENIDQALPGHLAVMSARTGINWTQWNVELARRTATAPENAAHLFAALDPTVQALRKSGKLQHFYFMRKSPDIRLRLRGNIQEINSAVAQVLEEARAREWVENFSRSIYEPETALFGGESAMELAHSYFDSDTSVWLEQAPAPLEYSAALLNRLFMSTLNCSNEVWQTWLQIESVDNAVDSRSVEPVDTYELHPRHVSANAELATGLQTLWLAGDLKVGLRAVLTSVAMFHFNRYGVPGPMQAALARDMAKRLHPFSYAGDNH